MTKYLRVKNWEKFQHYKDRNPPWIKLSRDLLRDYEFQCLQDASKLHLMLIWLLASQMDNKIPADEDFIKNQIGVKGKLHLKELINKGYLVDDSGVLAEGKQTAMPETEAYSKEGEKEAYSKEGEKEKEVGDFENFWNVYGKIGNKQQALKSWEKLKGVTYEEIIRGLNNYQAYCRAIGQEQRYIKHASTWLNNRGWEDEYTITEQAGGQPKSKSQRAREAALRGLMS